MNSLTPTPISTQLLDELRVGHAPSIAFKAQLTQWRAALLCGQAVYLELGDDAEPLATAIGEGLGQLLDVYDDGQRWSSLTVSLDAAPNRTHGVGENPLHIDYVQRTHPPDVIMLLGERDDPLGGGASLIAPFEQARSSLLAQDIALLSTPYLRYWNDEGAKDVGQALERFALFDGPWTRFTSKMLPHLDGSATVFTQEALDEQPRVREALLRFEASLNAHASRARLMPGHLLIFSQRHFAHGREALGHDQATLPPHRRRLLRQAYLRLIAP